MVDVLRSLPQGVYWYPLVLGLAVIVARRLLAIREGRRVTPSKPAVARTALAGYANLISRTRTDSFAEAELERLCIGMLLQGAGYRGYSVDACRHYLENEAPPRLIPVLRAHLSAQGNRPAHSHAQEGTLPHGCELVLRELERITEEPIEHHA